MVTFLGIVDTTFQFSSWFPLNVLFVLLSSFIIIVVLRSMCTAPADFQYLPPGLRVDPSSLQPVHNLSVTGTLSWLLFRVIMHHKLFMTLRNTGC